MGFNSAFKGLMGISGKKKINLRKFETNDNYQKY
jgi:hypothetical protein